VDVYNLKMAGAGAFHVLGSLCDEYQAGMAERGMEGWLRRSSAKLWETTQGCYHQIIAAYK